MDKLVTLRSYLQRNPHLDQDLVVAHLKEARFYGTLDMKWIKIDDEFEPLSIRITDEPRFQEWIDSFKGRLEKKD